MRIINDHKGLSLIYPTLSPGHLSWEFNPQKLAGLCDSPDLKHGSWWADSLPIDELMKSLSHPMVKLPKEIA